jgi:hypothetical protein
LFSPRIFSESLSHSKNKETELKKSIGIIEREKRAPKVSHEKGMNIFREEKNISISNLFGMNPFSLFPSIPTPTPNCFEKFLDSFGTIVDISYVAPQAHKIPNVALHREYSSDIVFIFSQGRKDLYHV